MNLEKALKILDVRAPLDEMELKHAYLTLVKSCHPDRFHDNETLKKEGEETLKNINLAYEYIHAHSSEFRSHNAGKRQEKSVDQKSSNINKDTENESGNSEENISNSEEQYGTSDETFKKRGFISKIYESFHEFFNSDGDSLGKKPDNVYKKRVKRKTFREILKEKDGHGYQKTRRRFHRSHKANANWFMLKRKHRTSNSGDMVEKIEPVRSIRGFSRKK